jgi:hypothetical protein
VVAGIAVSPLLTGSWSITTLAAPLAVLWWLALAALLASMLSLGAVIYPRTIYPGKQTSKVSYFGDAIGKSAVDLTAALEESSADPLLPIVDQIRAVSSIVAKKYLFTQWALLLFGLGLLLLIVVGVLSETLLNINGG